MSGLEGFAIGWMSGLFGHPICSPYAIIAAPIGLVGLGWGLINLRRDRHLIWSVPMFFLGCILWGYGFIAMLVWGSNH